jgi:predicted phage tail protein
MPNGSSPEVQLAVLGEQFKFIQQELAEAKSARKTQYEKMEEQSKTLAVMDARMQKVEASLQEQAPTIQEFITIKQRVVGAGFAGHWAWKAGGALICVLCYFRTEIFRWLSKS